MGAGRTTNTTESVQKAATALQNQDHGALVGIGRGISSMAFGTYTMPLAMLSKPMETITGLGNIARNPLEFTKTAVNSVSTAWATGNSEQRGEIASQVLISAGMLGLGAKGLYSTMKSGGAGVVESRAITAASHLESSTLSSTLGETTLARSRMLINAELPGGGVASTVTRDMSFGAQAERSLANSALGTTEASSIDSASLLRGSAKPGQIKLSEVSGNGSFDTITKPGQHAGTLGDLQIFDRPPPGPLGETQTLGPANTMTGRTTITAGHSTIGGELGSGTQFVEPIRIDPVNSGVPGRGNVIDFEPSRQGTISLTQTEGGVNVTGRRFDPVTNRPLVGEQLPTKPTITEPMAGRPASIDDPLINSSTEYRILESRGIVAKPSARVFDEAAVTSLKNEMSGLSLKSEVPVAREFNNTLEGLQRNFDRVLLKADSAAIQDFNQSIRQFETATAKMARELNLSEAEVAKINETMRSAISAVQEHITLDAAMTPLAAASQGQGLNRQADGQPRIASEPAVGGNRPAIDQPRVGEPAVVEQPRVGETTVGQQARVGEPTVLEQPKVRIFDDNAITGLKRDLTGLELQGESTAVREFNTNLQGVQRNLTKVLTEGDATAMRELNQSLRQLETSTPNVAKELNLSDAQVAKIKNTIDAASTAATEHVAFNGSSVHIVEPLPTVQPVKPLGTVEATPIRTLDEGAVIKLKGDMASLELRGEAPTVREFNRDVQNLQRNVDRVLNDGDAAALREIQQMRTQLNATTSTVAKELNLTEAEVAKINKTLDTAVTAAQERVTFQTSAPAVIEPVRPTVGEPSRPVTEGTGHKVAEPITQPGSNSALRTLDDAAVTKLKDDMTSLELKGDTPTIREYNNNLQTVQRNLDRVLNEGDATALRDLQQARTQLNATTSSVAKELNLTESEVAKINKTLDTAVTAAQERVTFQTSAPAVIEPVRPVSAEPVRPISAEPVRPGSAEPVRPARTLDEPAITQLKQDMRQLELPGDSPRVNQFNTDLQNVQRNLDRVLTDGDAAAIRELNKSLERLDATTPVVAKELNLTDAQVAKINKTLDTAVTAAQERVTFQSTAPAVIEPVRPLSVEPVRPVSVEPVRPVSAEPVRPGSAEPVRPATAEPIRSMNETAVTQLKQEMTALELKGDTPNIREFNTNLQNVRRDLDRVLTEGDAAAIRDLNKSLERLDATTKTVAKELNLTEPEIVKINKTLDKAVTAAQERIDFKSPAPAVIEPSPVINFEPARPAVSEVKPTTEQPIRQNPEQPRTGAPEYRPARTLNESAVIEVKNDVKLLELRGDTPVVREYNANLQNVQRNLDRVLAEGDANAMRELTQNVKQLNATTTTLAKELNLTEAQVAKINKTLDTAVTAAQERVFFRTEAPPVIEPIKVNTSVSAGEPVPTRPATINELQTNRVVAERNLSQLEERLPKTETFEPVRRDIAQVREDYKAFAEQPGPQQLRNLEQSMKSLERNLTPEMRAQAGIQEAAVAEVRTSTIATAKQAYASDLALTSQEQALARIQTIEQRTGSTLSKDFETQSRRLLSAETEPTFRTTANELDRSVSKWVQNQVDTGVISAAEARDIQAATAKFIAQSRDAAVVNLEAAPASNALRFKVEPEVIVAKGEPIVAKGEPVFGKAEPFVGKVEPFIAKGEPIVRPTEPVPTERPGIRPNESAPERAPLRANDTAPTEPVRKTTNEFAARTEAVSGKPIAETFREPEAVAAKYEQANAAARKLVEQPDSAAFKQAATEFKQAAREYNDTLKNNALGLDKHQIEQMSISTKETIQLGREQVANVNSLRVVVDSKADLISSANNLAASSKLPPDLAMAHVQNISSATERFANAETWLGRRTASQALEARINDFEKALGLPANSSPLRSELNALDASLAKMHDAQYAAKMGDGLSGVVHRTLDFAWNNAAVNGAYAVIGGLNATTLLGMAMEANRNQAPPTGQAPIRDDAHANLANDGVRNASNAVNASNAAAEQSGTSRTNRPDASTNPPAEQAGAARTAAAAAGASAASNPTAPAQPTVSRTTDVRAEAAAPNVVRTSDTRTDSVPLPRTDSAPLPRTDSTPLPRTESVPLPRTESAPLPHTDAAVAARAASDVNGGIGARTSLFSAFFGAPMTPQGFKEENRRMFGGSLAEFAQFAKGPGSQPTPPESADIPIYQQRTFYKSDTDRQERPTNRSFDYTKTRLPRALGGLDGLSMSKPPGLGDPRRSSNMRGGSAKQDNNTVNRLYPFLTATAEGVKSGAKGVPSKAPGSENSEALNPDQSGAGAPTDPNTVLNGAGHSTNDPTLKTSNTPQLASANTGNADDENAEPVTLTSISKS